MIFIRTDANKEIATGHVMRCAAVAGQLEQNGEKVCFLVSDADSERLVTSKGFACINLHSDWKTPCTKKELHQMHQILLASRAQTREIPGLLLDSYSITGEYTKNLYGMAKRIVIDDLFEETFCAEMVINYTLYHKLFDYAGRYEKSRTRLLLGGKYVPLRPVFAGSLRCRTAQPQGPMNILLICGGGDFNNAMGAILAAGVRAPDFMRHSFQVVAGAFNPHKKELAAYRMAYPNIHVHENVEDMAALMAQCDLAVSAASTVLYECCAMQLPTVFFCVAENQRYDRICFTENNMMVYAGDLQAEPDKTVSQIVSAVCRLAQEFGTRRQMQRKMAQVVDGQGAKRITEAVLSL